MPTSSQLLYFHLSLNADDDGVVEGYNVMRMINCTEDDLHILVDKKLIKILDEDLVTYITDWDEHRGINETAHKRISYKYRKWRESVLERDNYECKKCGYSGKTMNVHHIKHFAEYEEYRYDMDNAITLCERCHRKLHKEERKK